MEDLTFEDLKLFLQQPGANGLSLYDHLADLIEKIETVPENDRIELFEELSKELKLSEYLQAPSEETSLDETPAPNVLDRINTCELLKAVQLLKNEKSKRKPTAKQPQVQFPNMLEEAYFFKRFGVGLAEEELTVIYLHMKNFFSKMPLKSIRFFGKILGLDKNYYVVETEPSEPLPPLDDPVVAKSILSPEELAAAPNPKAKQPAEQPPADKPAAPSGEAAAEGHVDPDEPVIPPPKGDVEPPVVPLEDPKEGTPNQYVYWVCTSPLEDWVRLPDVTPSMIRQSRFLSKTLTGDLSAPVSAGYPAFDGEERHLLRALLARIAHSASLLPRRMIKRRPPGAEGEAGGEEEEEAEEEDEGNPMVSGVLRPNAAVDVATLAEPKSWVHSRPPILVQGRTEKWPPKRKPAEGAEEGGEEEEEGEEEGEEVEEEEEGGNPDAWKKWMKKPEVWEGTDEKGFGRDLRLKRAIDADKKMESGIPSFALRRDDLFDSSPVVLVKSLYWPGAFTIAYGGKKAKIASIYIGFGRKYNSLPFTLPPLPQLPDEYPDMDELIDPTVDQENQALSGKEEAAPARDRGEEEEEEEEEDYE